jgi:hypothetical protein
MKRVACTIISANYLHFGWTLAESFFKFHPEDEFHLLVVDRLPEDLIPRDPRVQVVEVEALGLPGFRSLAFKYSLLELNTAVKPSFLKYLLGRGAEKIIYFDPDIYLFGPAELIYEALDSASVVLTPHLLSPSPDRDHVYENDLLTTGVFNLGFIAVSSSSQARSFLDWWEERCLRFGFEDLRCGLFVDQKWIIHAPCFFDRVHILRDAGCNVAYWNLYERLLTETDHGYMVNDSSPLVFFHFSGYKPSAPDSVSTKLRTEQDVYPALRKLLLFYGKRLEENGAEFYRKYQYAYGRFSDGSPVTTLARRLYSVTMDQWEDQNPFDAGGGFFKAAKKAGVLSKLDQSVQYSSNNLPLSDWRIRAINRFLFFLPKVIGGNRYTMLMKYLSFITILRHQRQLLLMDEPAQGGR